MVWLTLFFISRNVDLREYLSEEVQAVHKNTTYDLIANIVHDGKPSEGSYRIHVLHHVSAVAQSCRIGAVPVLTLSLFAGVGALLQRPLYTRGNGFSSVLLLDAPWSFLRS